MLRRRVFAKECKRATFRAETETFMHHGFAEEDIRLKFRAETVENHRLLSAIDSFRHLPPTVLQQASIAFRQHHLEYGAVVIEENAVGTHFIVVLEGVVQVTSKGRKLSELGYGTVLGEISLLSAIKTTAAVTVSSRDGARILRMRKGT